MAFTYNYLPGTPIVWPGGLENIFSFNGLVLNDLTSGPDRYKFTKIDGLFDAEIRDSREVNPSRHGETAYTSFYGGKTITIEGIIRAGNMTKLRNMINALQAAFSDLTERPLFIYNYAGYQTSTPQAYITCKKSGPISIDETNSSRRMERAFTITLKAANPFVYSTTQTITTVIPNTVATGNNLGRSYNKTYNRSYAVIPTGLATQSITNNGNFNMEPILKIYGDSNYNVIINYTNGTSILFGWVQANQSVTLDLKNRTYTNSNGFDVTSSLDYSSDDFYLSPGVNVIGFGNSSSDNNGKLEIYARDTFI